MAQRRSLIGEILARQLAVMTFIGAAAFTGFWWVSNVAVRDQVHALTARWAENLDELAAPLAAAAPAEQRARLASYLAQFAELSFIRVYSPAGEPTATASRGLPAIAPLATEQLEALSSANGPLLHSSLQGVPSVRIAKPVWTASTSADQSSAAIKPATLGGFVELGLDFGSYVASESRVTSSAASIGIGVLILLAMASWLIYRRALLPLAALRKPLEQLAQGKTDIAIETSGHPEIAAIANVLKMTANALDERDQRLSHLASRDELTGLVNRTAFHALLAAETEAVASSGRTSALLYVDLDQFKYVNDSFGQAVGDRLLKVAADWFRASLRPKDVLARFVADEFVILLRDVTNKEAAAIGSELVKGLQQQSFLESDRSVNIRCSIGGTMVRGTRVEPAKLVSRAARASYQAKLNGRNQFCFYHVASKETAEMAADAGWSQKIQRALKEDAFVLHYQPIVSLRTRQTVYYEVLLRMAFDDEELSFPATFLPTAARLGLMVDIDHWVIRQSLRSLAALRFAHGDIRFTLNVSGSTFDRPDFFSYLETELMTAGVPLDAIVIEITEQTAMRNLSAAATRMADLVGRGCRFAIDDFGSGYCSYSYVKKLPLAFVKIDGSFITNLADDHVDQKIVAAIAEVAAATDCETIAEHVKDYETLRLLETLGVAYAQGYFLGRPSAQLTAATLPLRTMVTANRRLAPRRAAVDAARSRRVI